MNTRQIRSNLNELKVHLDDIDNWVRQANDIIYRIEEMTFDVEDGKADAMQVAPAWDDVNKILKGYKQNLGYGYKERCDFLQAIN